MNRVVDIEKFNLKKLVGKNAGSTLKLLDKIVKGLPFATIEKLHDQIGIPMETIRDAIGIPARTFSRRKSSGVLSREESDRLVSLIRLIDLSLHLFEGDKKAAAE